MVDYNIEINSGNKNKDFCMKLYVHIYKIFIFCIISCAMAWM